MPNYYYFSYKTNKYSANLQDSNLFLRKDECEKARDKFKKSGVFVTEINKKGES